MKSPHAWLAALLLLTFVSLVQAAGTTSTWTFTVNGVARSALVYVPDSATTSATPVIFAFHGHGGASSGARSDFKFDTRWPQAITIYPQGLAGVKTTQDPNGTQTGWQLSPGDQGNRDVVFFDQILARVQATYMVNASRVFCAGFSNGAYFTYVLWNQRPTIFAAYAPCSGGSGNYGSTLTPTPTILQVEDDPNSPVAYAQVKTKADILTAEKCSANNDQDWSYKSASTNSAPAPVVYQSTPAGSSVVYWMFHGTHQVLPEEAAQVVTFFQSAATTPTITSALSATAVAGTFFTYQSAATADPISFGAAGLPAGLSVDPASGVISGTPTTAGGFNVGLSATNVGGTGSATLGLTVANAVSPAPVITSAASASAVAGQAFSYQITATNTPTGFAATRLPTGLSVDGATGLISGTPTVAGTFSASLSATNGGGATQATLTLTVSSAVVSAPVINSGLYAQIQVGQVLSYQITASGSPTSYAAVGLPGGVTVNQTSGALAGVPAEAGTFSVVLSATNAEGTGQATLTLSVTAASTLQVATLSVPTPTVVLGSGDAGVLTVSLSAPATSDVIIHYTVKGSAVNGTDYVLLKGTKKIKAGKTSKNIKIIPLGDLDGASKKVVKLVLTAGDGYTVGTATPVKVKILGAP